MIIVLNREMSWLLLPLLLLALVLLFGAALKTPLLRDKRLRVAVYGGCIALSAAETARLLICRAPALLYASTAGAGTDSAAELLIARYQALATVAAPTNVLRWMVLVAVLIVWGLLALRARREN